MRGKDRMEASCGISGLGTSFGGGEKKNFTRNNEFEVFTGREM